MFVVQTHNLLCCLVIGMHRFGTDRIMLDTVTIDERAWQVDRPDQNCLFVALMHIDPFKSMLIRFLILVLVFRFKLRFCF